MRVVLIECRTGCTCCSYENHYRGPYCSTEDAKRRIESFLSKDSKFFPLASQYARQGNYSVREFDYEQLPDGRIILAGERVFPELKSIVVNPDGSIPVGDTEEVFAHDLF
jgi:hypothetical protein